MRKDLIPRFTPVPQHYTGNGYTLARGDTCLALLRSQLGGVEGFPGVERLSCRATEVGLRASRALSGSPAEPLR